MSKLPPVQFVMCERCGYDRDEHYTPNLSDGQFVGMYLLICPTSVFKAKGHGVSGDPYKAGK